MIQGSSDIVSTGRVNAICRQSNQYVYNNGWLLSEIIWVILAVDESGLLGVPQAMSQFGRELTHQSGPAVLENPFASPVKLGSDSSTSLVSSPASCSMIAQPGSAPNSPHPDPASASLSPQHVRNLFEVSSSPSYLFIFFLIISSYCAWNIGR